MIIDGKIIIGDLIVPQTFKQKVLRDNVVVNDEYVVQGRKVLLITFGLVFFKDMKN